MGIVLGARTGEVQNGSAFEKAALDLPRNVRFVRVPDDAVVELAPVQGRIEIYLEKVLAFDGATPPMSIVEGRHRLGVAYQHEQRLLTIATHGAWIRHNAGGAEVRVVLRVPVGLEVEHCQGLSGAFSAAHAEPIEDIDFAAVEQRRQSPEVRAKLDKLRGQASDPMKFVSAMLEDPSKLHDLMETQRELMQELYGVDIGADEDDDPWNDSQLSADWHAIATELDPDHTATSWMPKPPLVAEPGIVLGEDTGGVLNGSAFERATIDVPPGVRTVHVPTHAAVESVASDGRIEIYLEKVLSFYGQAGMSILDSRHEIGVSYQHDSTRLWFVTFGEWDSEIEGGMDLRVLLRVPASLAVERSDDDEDFEGPEPPTNEVPIMRESPGRVFATGMPRGTDPNGWRPIATELDPELTARRGVTPAEVRKRAVAALDTSALRDALWALKSGLDQQQLAPFVRGGESHTVDLGGGLSRCLDQLSLLASTDQELAGHLTSGAALLRDHPRGDSDPRWAPRLQELKRVSGPRVDAQSLWAGDVFDWLRSVLDLLPQEMPKDDYFEGLASFLDPQTFGGKKPID